MIEKPSITNERIISAVEERYSIQVQRVEFLPLGWDADSWSYRVEAERENYFLKLRRNIQNPAGILIPRFLKAQGIDQVMAPLSSVRGEAWEKVDEFYFILYPFIMGKQVMDVGMSDAHWVEFGSVLRKLHSTELPEELMKQLRRERFAPKWLEFDTQIHAQVKSQTYDDPFQKELAEFWLEHYSTITTLLERTESLAKQMQSADLQFVLCHADVHTANVLRTEDDRIFIVDWDETMLAPRERDLLFVIGSILGDTTGGRAEQLIFEGYGSTQVNMLALAYYRYLWCIEDMGGFAEQIFTVQDAGEETKKSALSIFKNLFSHGDSVEIALGTEIRE